MVQADKFQSHTPIYLIFLTLSEMEKPLRILNRNSVGIDFLATLFKCICVNDNSLYIEIIMSSIIISTKLNTKHLRCLSCYCVLFYWCHFNVCAIHLLLLKILL
jgi:hypothetical protein